MLACAETRSYNYTLISCEKNLPNLKQIIISILLKPNFQILSPLNPTLFFVVGLFHPQKGQTKRVEQKSKKLAIYILI